MEILIENKPVFSVGNALAGLETSEGAVFQLFGGDTIVVFLRS